MWCTRSRSKRLRGYCWSVAAGSRPISVIVNLRQADMRVSSIGAYCAKSLRVCISTKLMVEQATTLGAFSTRKATFYRVPNTRGAFWHRTAHRQVSHLLIELSLARIGLPTNSSVTQAPNLFLGHLFRCLLCEQSCDLVRGQLCFWRLLSPACRPEA